MKMETRCAVCINDVALRYLSMQPLYTYRDLLVEYINSYHEQEDQKVLLQETLYCHVCSEYPISNQYNRAFLKLILKLLEDSGSEISEELYEAYTTSLSKASDDQSMCYKHYITSKPGISIDVHIKLRESTMLVSDGTTGLRTWPAAVCLAEWLRENSHTIQHKNMVELGCGLGFTGIAVLKFCRPRSYHFTDCHHSVLNLMKENIQINDNVRYKSASWKEIQCEDNNMVKWKLQTPECVEGGGEQTACDVYVCRLDWEEASADVLCQLPCQVVLAADVVYDTCIIPSLIRVLKTLLTSKQQNTVCYMASTVRNCDTMTSFKEACSNADILWTLLPGPKDSYWIYDRTVPIEIVKLWCNR